MKAIFILINLSIDLKVLENSGEIKRLNTWDEVAPMANLLFLIWMCGSLGPLLLRHRKPQRLLERPFVLFLRRFSTFSDRAVIALVLRQAPSGMPVVFLTPTRSRPGDWDPFVVGFAGLKLWHPFQSTPIVLRARDERWRQIAEELISRARLILLDMSEVSNALQAEVEMITRAGRWSDTVCLRHEASDAGPDTESSGVSSEAQTIVYKKSWVRALPRMLTGLFFVVAVGLALELLVGIFAALAAVFFYVSTFVRPAINRKFRTALRTRLRTGSQTASVTIQRGVQWWRVAMAIVLAIMLPGLPAALFAPDPSDSTLNLALFMFHLLVVLGVTYWAGRSVPHRARPQAIGIGMALLLLGVTLKQPLDLFFAFFCITTLATALLGGHLAAGRTMEP